MFICLHLQSNTDHLEDNSSYCGVAICDDQQCSDSSDESTDEWYSDSDESIHSIEAPPFSPIVMDGTDSGDDELDIDILIPATNEPCKSCEHLLCIHLFYTFPVSPYVFNEHGSTCITVDESATTSGLVSVADSGEPGVLLTATDEPCMH